MTQETAAPTLREALKKFLADNDPEGFGCACEPKRRCGPCFWRERVDAPLRATLTTIPSATEPDRNAAPEGWKLLKDTTQDERSWPEDYVDENGQYFNTCHNCLRVFLGYKRRGTCKVCATRTDTKD